MISPTEYSRAGSGTETLADVLTRAPIPLPIGLKWAATVAGLLQDMHQRDCRHGKVTSANVVMRPDGPELVPPAQGFWRECSAERRSEEHTSELQSRFGISYAVFCLKKK